MSPAAANPALPTTTEPGHPVQENVAAPAAAEPAEALRPLWWLPCRLTLQVSLERFTVGELLRLRSGGLVATGWARSKEVPLYANGQRIGSCELEMVGDHIGARILELV